MTESALERRCAVAAKRAGGELIKILPWSLRGLPDRLLIMPLGSYVWLEFKAPDGRLTPLQGFWERRLGQLGCEHRVIRSWEEFDEVLAELVPEQDDPRAMGWVDDRGRP